jgi:hypothetical protein
MEFHGLDTIIETLLVGAIVSVCLMSLVFLFFGHKLQVKVIRTLLEFLLYEKDETIELKESIHLNPQAEAKPQHHDPEHQKSQHSEAQHSEAQHSEAQHSEAQHSEAQHSEKQQPERQQPEGQQPEGQQPEGQQPEAHPRRAHAGAPIKEAASKAQEIFLVVLVVSSLYGLGVVTEALSADALRDADAQIKRDAFVSVSAGQLAGGTARPDFARFFTDYNACAKQFQTRDGKRSSDKTAIKTDTHELCTGLSNHETGFYYNAKNLVFREETFQKELGTLQSRINFVRSVAVALFAVAVQLVAATLIAFIAEAVYQLNKRWHFFGPSSGQSRGHHRRHSKDRWGWAGELASHWRKFDALRCLLFSLGAIAMYLFAHRAWFDCETQFDKRVYGYFLTMSKEEVAEVTPQSTYRVFAIDKLHSFEPSGVQPLGQSERVIVINDKGLGNDAFVVFDRGAPPEREPEKDERAKRAPEPAQSASSERASKPAQAVPSASVQVPAPDAPAEGVADEDNVRSAQISAGRWDVLRNPRALKHGQVQGEDSLSDLYKFESIHTLETGDARSVEVFASTTFARPDAASRNIVHFYVNPDTAVASDVKFLWGRDEAVDVCSVLNAEANASEPTCAKPRNVTPSTCQIEGLVAFKSTHASTGSTVAANSDSHRKQEHETKEKPSDYDPSDYHFILGVRYTFQNGGNKKPVIALIAMNFEDGCWKPSRLFLRAGAEFQNRNDKQENAERLAPGPCFGISDLEVTDKALFVLTSYEHSDNDHCTEETGAAVDEVSGKLWRLRFDEQKSLPDTTHWELVEEFIHKPEGVGRTLDGSLLVVFDDDASRKSMDLAPSTFPLEQNESVFAAIGPHARPSVVVKEPKPTLWRTYVW